MPLSYSVCHPMFVLAGTQYGALNGSPSPPHGFGVRSRFLQICLPGLGSRPHAFSQGLSMALSRSLTPVSLDSAQARAGVHLSRVLTGALVSQVIPVSVNDNQGSSVLSPSGWRTEKAKERSPQYIGLVVVPRSCQRAAKPAPVWPSLSRAPQK